MSSLAKQWLVLFGAIFIMVGFYLFIQSNKPVIVVGKHPVKQYEISKDKDRAFLTVEGTTDSNLSDLVDMRYFSPLKSGVTQQEAVEKLGIPSNLRETSGGSKIMEFQQDGYRIDVILVISSEGEEYLLRTNPNNVFVYDILPSYITDKISTEQNQSTITVDSGGQSVFIFTEGNRVESMEWRDYN